MRETIVPVDPLMTSCSISLMLGPSNIITLVVVHYTKGSRKALIMLSIYYSIVRAVVAAPRVEKNGYKSGLPSAAGVLTIHSQGTCMQN